MELILIKELIETAMQQLRNFGLSVGTLKSYKTRAFHQIETFFCNRKADSYDAVLMEELRSLYRSQSKLSDCFVSIAMFYSITYTVLKMALQHYLSNLMKFTLAAFTDLAEFLGATLGLNLLFGIPMLYATILTGVATYLILMLDCFGFRPLEKFIAAFVWPIFNPPIRH